MKGFHSWEVDRLADDAIWTHIWSAVNDTAHKNAAVSEAWRETRTYSIRLGGIRIGHEITMAGL